MPNEVVPSRAQVVAPDNSCHDAAVSLSGGAAMSPFELPDQRLFRRVGLSVKRELHGGFQSRVVQAVDQRNECAPPLAVKLMLVEADDRSTALERIRVRDQVSRLDDRVVPIVPIDANKVNRIGDTLAVASPLIEGRTLDITSRADVERMGRALSRLHESLRICRANLPVVAALRVNGGADGLNENHQLLHGDFSPSNLLLDDDGRLWVLDFDDCGYGPVEFELGNTLFMTCLLYTSPSPRDS